MEVTSGVPQEPVLGPLLFVIFVNDLPEVIEGYCKPYADDSKSPSNESSAESLQRNIDSITNWTKERQMKLNYNK